MVFRGHIERGKVVFDDPAALTEGTKVEIHVVGAPPSSSENAQKRHWLEFSGAVDDLPPDASMRVDEIVYGRPDE